MHRWDGKRYIDKAELNEEIRRYRQTGVPSERLGEMILTIAKHLGGSSRFNGYSFNEDMIYDGVSRVMTAALPKLDPDRECFSYITRTIWCAFIWRIKTEKNYWNTKCAIYERLIGKECTWKNSNSQQNDANEGEDGDLEKYPQDEEDATEDDNI